MSISITHFEIPADDVKRAKKFYEKAFGWKISDPWKMNYFFVETKQKAKRAHIVDPPNQLHTLAESTR